MKLTFFTFLFSILFHNVADAQPVYNNDASKKAQKNLQAGIEDAMNGKTDLALQNFLEAIEEEPNFITAISYAGSAFKDLGNDSMAVIYFLKAIDLKADFDVGVYKKLAESEQNLTRYADAEKHIMIFLQNQKIVGESRKKAEHLLTSVQFAKEAILHPVNFNPINMGPEINSVYAEYFPSLSADKSLLIFTRKIEKDKNASQIPGETDMNEDFYISDFKDTAWKVAKNVGSPVNTKLNEGAQNISVDGKLLFYTLCNSPLGFGSCDLYYSFKIGGEWTNPENCGRTINSADWESQPSISADKKYLYFSSTRPGGYGAYDIWIAEMDNQGKWKKPVNAGPMINTAYDEQCPFIHPDGRTLYFSSNGHPGFGQSDLFFSKKGLDGNWEKPVNLGYPINTQKSEITLSVSADGNTAYYASDRKDSYGELDIYTFDLPSELKPFPVTYVKATVRDEKTKIPLASSVQLIDLETGDTIINSTSDNMNGEFLVTLPIGKKYALFVNKKGYLFHSENFSLENAIPESPYLIDIYLQPVQIGEIITLNNIFFETASSELLPESQTELIKIKELLDKNPSVIIQLNGHTDNVGEEKDNMQLSIERALSVKTFLEKQGVNAERLKYKGYGETQPVSDNNTEEGRSKNRRTEMEILSL